MRRRGGFKGGRTIRGGFERERDGRRERERERESGGAGEMTSYHLFFLWL